MAITHTFTTDEDFLGLEEEGKLLLTTHSLGKSDNLVEKQGADGDFVAHRVFGTTCAPSCNYEIVSAQTAFKKLLGKVYQSTRSLATGPIALKSFTISTSAGGKPTFSAEGVQIEAGATSCAHQFETSEISISPDNHAIDFGAFSFTGDSDTDLASSTYTADCTIDPAEVDGLPVASDAAGGFETVQATFWSADGAPSVTANTTDGWFISSPLTRTRDDGDFETWECTFKHYLEASTPAAESTSSS